MQPSVISYQSGPTATVACSNLAAKTAKTAKTDERRGKRNMEDQNDWRL
jgi:hypothetical protein